MGHVAQALKRSFPTFRVIGAKSHPQPYSQSRGDVAGMASFTRTEYWAVILILDPPGSALPGTLPGTLKGRSIGGPQHWSCLRFVPLRSCLAQQFRDKTANESGAGSGASLMGRSRLRLLFFLSQAWCCLPSWPSCSETLFPSHLCVLCARSV